MVFAVAGIAGEHAFDAFAEEFFAELGIARGACRTDACAQRKASAPPWFADAIIMLYSFTGKTQKHRYLLLYCA
jgi:hypothetical protein